MAHQAARRLSRPQSPAKPSPSRPSTWTGPSRGISHSPAPAKPTCASPKRSPAAQSSPQFRPKESTPPPQKTTHQNPGYTPPRLLHSVNPEYSPEARAAKFSGICVVALTIDTQGNPINVHVEKPIGMGLDENAINAVKQYRFTPATQNGVPIAKRIHIEVAFQYY